MTGPWRSRKAGGIRLLVALVVLSVGITAVVWTQSADPGGELPGPANPEIGVPYPYDLYTHCGVTFARFGGRVWRKDGGVGVYVRRPREDGTVVEDGYTGGTMTMIDENTIVFRVDEQLYETDRRVEFVYHPSDEEPPWCQ